MGRMNQKIVITSPPRRARDLLLAGSGMALEGESKSLLGPAARDLFGDDNLAIGAGSGLRYW